MYCVKAVDAAGNLMFHAGRYGNETCRGGGGDELIPGTKIVRNPEVPLSRPSGMAVYGDYLLISDMLSHRVARCALSFAEAKEAPLK
jgi:hypothetical protein